MISPGTVVDDRYEVRRRLGEGGSGEVWLAADAMLHRDVALKLVSVDVEPDRLRREARAAARVAHPNVVAVYDAGEIEHHAYLVMELVDGADLAAIVRHGGPLSPATVAAVARDLGRALQAVHDAGFVHRDVTPGNLLVTRDGTVKLADLGTARVVGGDGVDRVTRTGIVIGTVDYLAPEQLGSHDTTPATDVYAAGLVLRTCATAERPFGGGTVTERAARRLTEDVPSPSGPDWLVELVAVACQREAADRPRDGAALAAAIDRLLPSDDSDRSELTARVAAAAASGDGTDEAAGLDTDGVAGSDRTGPRDRTTAIDRGAAHDRGADATTAIPTTGPRPARADDDRTRIVPTPPPARSDDRGADQPRRDRSTPPATPRAGSRWGRRVTLVLLAAAVVAGVGWAITTDLGPASGPGRTPYEIAGADDFDPLSERQEENDDQVPNVLDGDASTTWSTEGYNDGPDITDVKAGVGLVLDLGGPRDVGAVEVDLASDGIDLQAYVSDETLTGDPADDEAAALLGRREGASGTATLDDAPVEGRYVTVWITKLDDRAGDDGRYRAAVAEIRVLP